MTNKFKLGGCNYSIPLNSKPAVCPICKEGFRYRQTLRRHIQKCHKGERNNEELAEWFNGLKKPNAQRDILIKRLK